MHPLLSPYFLNATIALQNRAVVAPMTMCLASKAHTPGIKMQEHYQTLAQSLPGLMISEATMVDKLSTGYPNTPGVYNSGQVEAWKPIVQAVRAYGCKFFSQLWHAGAMSHFIYRNGCQPISAFNVPPLRIDIPRTKGRLQYPVPRPMDAADMQEVIQSFNISAQNSLLAGFDGVEIHAANGYLLDSFLHHYTNRRQDEYGGSKENMCRFVLQLVDQVAHTIGAERLGIRLSPTAIPSMENMQDELQDVEVFIHLLKELEKRKIAYVHISSDNDALDQGLLKMPVSSFVRQYFKGNLIGCGSFNYETARKALEKKQCDLVAFGRPFLKDANYLNQLRARL